MVNAALLVIVMAVIIALLISAKRKKSTPSSSLAIQDNHAPMTEYYICESSEIPPIEIKITSTKDIEKTWTLPVIDNVLIGRADNSDICLNDITVSREQCKIAVVEGELAIVHTGTTNKTILNGNNVTKAVAINTGDTIKIGRETLQIDYIKIPVQTLQETPPHPTVSGNSTASIF